MRTDEFEEILRRARQHDADAVEAIFNLYSARVYGLLYRLTGSRDDADDLLQETFLRLVRTISRYEHDGRFDAWLFRIAANLTRDRGRKHRRRAPSAPLDVYATGENDSADDRALAVDRPPDFSILRNESEARLAEAMQRLTEVEREVLVLRHYSDLPFREIAKLLEIPLGTALARAHRALLRLRANLADVDR
ncbi:MAG: sigma-70 family RNA polymerase sigma factor [Phycisphaerales bacterium]|nr:sigma-70 family RNA polymerase sigma factor [Phycisphaerales bacterium]